MKKELARRKLDQRNQRKRKERNEAKTEMLVMGIFVIIMIVASLLG